MPAVYQHRRVGDPACTVNGRRRSPKLKQGKRSQFALEFVAQVAGVGVAVGKLPAVGRILRPGRGRKVGGGIHIVPPEHTGNRKIRVDLPGEFTPSPLPNFLARDELVRLLPKLNLRIGAVVPAVANDTGFARPLTRYVGRLHRGRHGRQHRVDGGRVFVGHPLCQERRVFAHQRIRQADYVEDYGLLHS